MKGIWAFLFVGAALVFLLSYGTAPVWAYAPPLAASGSASGSSVNVSVWDPMRQMGQAQGYHYVDPVLDFQQHNGLMAWVVKIGTNYYVACCTYDPPQGKFIDGSNGPFSSVSQLKVQDGVIAWLADASVYSATYDPEVPILHPASSPWQTTSSYSPNIYSMQTADGVVAWTRTESALVYAGFCVYHPKDKVWKKDEVIVLDNNPSFSISLASVFVDGDIYGLILGFWFKGYNTTPYAYFVAQPTSGKAPLWVWFTDLTIAPTSGSGTLWNWVFGDGNNTIYTARSSSYHTYQKGRVYTASLLIYNGQPPPKATIRVYPINLPFLPLLLID